MLIFFIYQEDSQKHMADPRSLRTQAKVVMFQQLPSAYFVNTGKRLSNMYNHVIYTTLNKYTLSKD